MNPEQLIRQLEVNASVFKVLFENKDAMQIRWKPDENSWSLLEIICHLYDEEREDFRTRVFHILSTPDLMPPSIDPQGWVKSRNYDKQDYDEKLKAFLDERKLSIQMLKELINPPWENVFKHPQAGPITGYQMLANWLAHDYHHIRQVNRRLYEYLRIQSNVSLAYAGDW